MQMCVPHHESLKAEIERVGLKVLVPETGAEAAERLHREHYEGLTIDNFDPLMGATLMILKNCVDTLIECGGNPALLMTTSEQPWACPICHLNEIVKRHEPVCPERDLPPEQQRCNLNTPFDDWIPLAVNGQLEAWKAMKP